MMTNRSSIDSLEPRVLLWLVTVSAIVGGVLALFGAVVVAATGRGLVALVVVFAALALFLMGVWARAFSRRLVGEQCK